MTSTIYDIQINSLKGSPILWREYDGKKILIVNVASACGYTPQYTQLQKLQEDHQETLVVIGVPCNDFGGQEPGSADEIETFCEINYGVTFPLTEKIGITTTTHPLYQWLTKKSLNLVSDADVKWNFHKFLILEDGTWGESFSSDVSPLAEEILTLL